jgi:hypothetical protein
MRWLRECNFTPERAGRQGGKAEEKRSAAGAQGQHHRPAQAGERRGEQEQQLSLFPSKEDCLRAMLKEVDPDSLSPRQAQEMLYELVEEAMKMG